MKELSGFLKFLNELEKRKISYQLNKVRKESIMIAITVPGQRWEIEFMEDGTCEIEKFISDGKILDEKEIKILFDNFSD